MFQLDFQLLQVTIGCPRQGTGQQKICILIDEESITCHKRRYIVLPMKANNTIWSNITLQKSCKKVRAQQEAFLHISCVFLFIFVGFHVTLKRNYGLNFLKVIINIWQLQRALRFPTSHTSFTQHFYSKIIPSTNEVSKKFCCSLGLLCILFCGQLPINFKRSGGLNITTNYWP